jgi:protein-disulfide isomerase
MPSFKTLAAALAVLTLPLTTSAQEIQPLDPAQKQQMEQVVREYLVNNPEVIIEALESYQQREREAAQVRQRDAMGALQADLQNNPNDPVIGNPDGDVTVVEFFDYRCGYCKRVFDDVQTLLKEDGNIRFILKEFPILGPDSVNASRAAQAVWLHQKDKYLPFHIAMMNNKGDLNEAKIMELATNTGVDTALLKEQMSDPLVETTLNDTARMASALDITGTPAFIFGAQVQPGAIPLDMMKELVGAMRSHP